jgi:hypothetical protein
VTESTNSPLTVGLVGCGKTKLPHPAPAGELYTGQLFRAAFAYARKTYDRTYILSAKYGLVHPATVIAPYDLTLTTLPRAARIEDKDEAVRVRLIAVAEAPEPPLAGGSGQGQASRDATQELASAGSPDVPQARSWPE